MAEHTPGPWEEFWIRPNKAKGYAFEPTCSILATTNGTKVRLADIPDPVSSEYEANARLIASAPDLLAAAEKVIANWEQGDLADAVRLMASVVEQAKGESDQ